MRSWSAVSAWDTSSPVWWWLTTWFDIVLSIGSCFSAIIPCPSFLDRVLKPPTVFRSTLPSGKGILCETAGLPTPMLCPTRGTTPGLDRGKDTPVVVFACDMGPTKDEDVVCVNGMFPLVIAVCCMNVWGRKVYPLFTMPLGKLPLFNMELFIFVAGAPFNCWHCDENMLWVGSKGGAGHTWFIPPAMPSAAVVRVVFVVACGDERKGNCAMPWNLGSV